MDPSPEILMTTPLTKWIDLDFGEQVTVFPNAMSFADVDNDGVAEFVTGSMQGELYVFKGMSGKYWKKATNLGMITVVGAGDILQKKKNVIYAVTGEGTLYTFAITSGPLAHVQRELDEPTRSREPSGRSRGAMEPTFMQKIPPNICMSALADIDGDGYPEILFGMTDRVVRSFKWNENANGGSFVTLNKWEFAGQIGNLSSGLSDGVAQIYVSQPGGSCCRLKACVSLDDPVLEIKFEPPVYHNSAVAKARNPSMQTQVLAGVCFDEPKSPASRRRQHSADRNRDAYAVCSFDGSLMVCCDDRILWEIQTSEHLIAIQSLPLRDEILVAAGSGAVYVVDRRKKMIKLLTAEPMSGFVAGLYGAVSSTKDQQACCAFATICSGGRIVLYYDLNIPPLESVPCLWRRKIVLNLSPAISENLPESKLSVS